MHQQFHTNKDNQGRKQPAEHFELHNLGPVVSYRYQLEIFLIQNNLHEFHRSVRKGIITVKHFETNTTNKISPENYVNIM